jgi:hypothetical protein
MEEEKIAGVLTVGKPTVYINTLLREAKPRIIPMVLELDRIIVHLGSMSQAPQREAISRHMPEVLNCYILWLYDRGRCMNLNGH